MGTNSDFRLKFVLQGWAANSTRRSEGVAFVALDPASARARIENFRDQTPRILISPLIDWSWSDIANSVAGIVTDHGTRVSRGSEVSGIVQVAAVLGTRDATTKIKDGDYIKIICEGNEALAKVFEPIIGKLDDR
ncbi:MAG: PEP-utilizing enzyme [Candidatus Hodarchaeales archaeon]|jgi:phosphohistidine swiveling domain-containing protein